MSAPYRPLVEETPEQREIRELRDSLGWYEASRKFWERNFHDEVMRHARTQRSADHYERKADAAFALFAGTAVMLVVYVAVPLLAAWWASW